jgi:deazaflavin-dependent oxidoreductase (nitroreductase family)
VTWFQRLRRRVLLVVWRLLNPPARRLAGIAPWWVVIETTGRVSRKPRETPLARGPVDGDSAWLMAVHGRHSAWVKNIEANPAVRLRLRGRWRPGTATVVPFDRQIAARFGRYARSGPATLGIDPVMVRVETAEEGAPAAPAPPRSRG